MFIDETSTNTKLTKRTGWSPRGERYTSHTPFGAWTTQTFIAGLRCHALTAPWIVNAPMNRQIFEIYVETQLAPTLSPGDVVILDNVAFHKSPRAEALVRKRGAWLLFLPPYSPELNPIVNLFQFLKHNFLNARVYDTYEDIVEACCRAWNSLLNIEGNLKSITTRSWAKTITS